MPSATVSFNNRPINVDIISSGTYTVPADTYARIVCQVEAGGDIAINGETALRSRGVDPVSQSSTGGGALSTTYNIPSGYYFEGHAILTGSFSSGSVTIGGITHTSLTSGSVEIKGGGGDAIVVSGTPSSGTPTVALIGYAVPLDSGMAVAEFWVDAGDEVVISGTGRITYMEYQA